jgi:hypothetical protein
LNPGPYCAFDDPIPTPNGKTPRTLKDAAAYIMALPKRKAKAEDTWPPSRGLLFWRVANRTDEARNVFGGKNQHVVRS